MAHCFDQVRALAPLVATAQALGCHERRDFLDDLRREAPTVTAEVERLLDASAVTPLEMPLPTGPGVVERPWRLGSRLRAF